MTNSLKECTNDSVLTGRFFPLLHHYFTYFPKAQTGYNKMNLQTRRVQICHYFNKDNV